MVTGEDCISRHTSTAITAQVVARVLSLGSHELTTDASLLAKQCMLDWFGVALSARQEPLVGMLIDQATEDGAGRGASVPGCGSSFSPRQAALINGAMGHAIDYDDVHLDAQGHVTAAIFPAVLALAESRRASGPQLLSAFVCGYDAMVMVGRYVGQPHYDLGFHGTGTLGTFGAAAACGALLGLDAQVLARALGIAGTQAAGLKAQFGTMCKPLHAGKSNENGLLAAQLARRGFSSRSDLIECDQGFGKTLSPSVNAHAALLLPGGEAHIRHTLFKFDAACYGTHAAIAAARRIRQEHGLAPDQIHRVTVTLEPTLDRMCNIPEPRTGLEAKFSVRFNVAMALAGEDTSSPDVYTDAVAHRADLVALRNRIAVNPAPTGMPRMCSEVTIETMDGRQLSASYDTSVPASDIGIQGERLLHKFLKLATPVVGSDRAHEISRAILDMEHLGNIADLTALVR